MLKINHSNGPFYIGRTPWNVNDDFGGIIRDVRIWDYTRTQKEIKKYYNIIFKSNTELTKILFAQQISFIKECSIFTKCFKEFPDGIIEIIVKYDGCGLIACFPLINDNKTDKKVYDIVQGIIGEFKGEIKWIKDPHYSTT